MNTDRIEKKVLLRAKQSRVWQALTNSEQFGSWFGVQLDGPFTPGATMRGIIAPSTVDERKGSYDGRRFEFVIDRIEPERLFSLRWHPFALDETVDYSKESMTQVTFTLEAKDGGVLLTVTESGFDSLPLARRAAALKANDGGWSTQLERIEKYLAHTS